MIGEIIHKIDSNNFIVFCNGVLLKAYAFEDIEICKPKKIMLIPFITSKVKKESFFNLNANKDKKLLIDNFEKASYQAYGKIIETNPLTIDCGSVQLELDEEDFYSEINIKQLEKGIYVYFYIDRLDVEKV